GAEGARGVSRSQSTVQLAKGTSPYAPFKGGIALSSSHVASRRGMEHPSAFAARVNEPVGLIDIAPTILQFLGIPRPQDFQGLGFLELVTLKGSVDDREVVGESLYAKNHFGCSWLQSLRLGNFKYVAAPKPELYDLSRDPREQHNLCAEQAASARALGERLE